MAATLVMIAVAVSAYGTFAARREVSATLVAVAPVQTLVAAAFAHTGAPPASERDVPGLAAFGHPRPSIESLTVVQGTIEIEFGDHAAAGLRGRTLQLTPFETAEGQVVWLCGNARAGPGLYPLGFSGGTNLPVEARTTVEPRFVPQACR